MVALSSVPVRPIESTEAGCSVSAGGSVEARLSRVPRLTIGSGVAGDSVGARGALGSGRPGSSRKSGGRLLNTDAVRVAARRAGLSVRSGEARLSGSSGEASVAGTARGSLLSELSGKSIRAREARGSGEAIGSVRAVKAESTGAGTEVVLVSVESGSSVGSREAV